MMSLSTTIILTLVTFLPLATGLVLLATGGREPCWRSSGLSPAVWRASASGRARSSPSCSRCSLWNRFDREQSGFQFVERAAWMPDYGVNYFVGIDGISLVLWSCSPPS